MILHGHGGYPVLRNDPVDNGHHQHDDHPQNGHSPQDDGPIGAQVVDQYQVHHGSLSPMSAQSEHKLKSLELTMNNHLLDEPKVNGKGHGKLEEQGSQIIQIIVKVFRFGQRTVNRGDNVNAHLNIDQQQCNVEQCLGQNIAQSMSFARFRIAIHPQIEAKESQCQQERINVFHSANGDEAILVDVLLHRRR